MTHDQHVGVHRVQRHRRVYQGFALAHRRDRDGHVDDIGAEPLAGDLERRAGARRILEKAVDQRAAPQGRALLVGLPAQLDIGVGEIEHMLDILPAQPLDAEQMPVPETVWLHEDRTIEGRS
jgi:hypothetical protein